MRGEITYLFLVELLFSCLVLGSMLAWRFWIFYVFGFCFRTLAVILVSEFWTDYTHVHHVQLFAWTWTDYIYVIYVQLFACALTDYIHVRHVKLFAWAWTDYIHVHVQMAAWTWTNYIHVVRLSLNWLHTHISCSVVFLNLNWLQHVHHVH